MSAKFIWYRSGSFGDELEVALMNRTITLAKKVFEGIVARTPVSTGAARASWSVSVGSPAPVVRTGGSIGAPLPPPIFPLKTAPAYSKIYITNGVPYIMPLEYGSSKQAPQGMVRVTLVSLGLRYGV